MLVRADGLFRLDVAVEGDTLKTVVRNLSGAELNIHDQRDYDRLPAVASGDVLLYEPGSVRLRFDLGAGDDLVRVSGTLTTLKLVDRGMVRISGQLIVRSAHA